MIARVQSYARKNFPALLRLASIVEQSKSVGFDKRTGKYSVLGSDGRTYSIGVNTARHIQALELALISDDLKSVCETFVYVANHV